MNEQLESIGKATMEEDGTVVLQIRAAEAGLRGQTLLRYSPDHAEYRSILEHLGGLEPGDEKPVPPWPDSD
jgi:hypothetical protein